MPKKQSAEIFEVEKFIDFKQTGIKKDKFKLLIRWKGYSEEHDTWEPLSNFKENKYLYYNCINYILSKKSFSGLKRSKRRLYNIIL